MRHRLALCVLLASSACATEFIVGPGRRFATPSQVAPAVHNGDIVSIEAATYTGDVCVWSQSGITLRGIGGRPRLAAGGRSAKGEGTWVLEGDDITVENIEFCDAVCADRNGAGIRAAGGNLTVRGCLFHDNQNGILSNANPRSDIVIEGCEFAANGAGDGQSHNLYIGRVRSLTFRWNYSHHAKVGHNLKTRAEANCIVGNRIMDEATGRSSYLVDVPNGGLTFLLGNLIEKGPGSSNTGQFVSYGEEGAANPVQHIYAINNTFVADGGGDCTALALAGSTTLARIENNLLIGVGGTARGPVTTNLRNLNAGNGALVNRAAYDYRLAPGAAAIDAAPNPGSAEGQVLLPAGQYVHPCGMEPRTVVGAAVDIGAYEFGVRPVAKKASAAGEPKAATPRPAPPKVAAKPPPKLTDPSRKADWIARLRAAAAAEVAAHREPEFVLAGLGAQVLLREVQADGTLVVALAGSGDLTLPWSGLGDRDRASLAVALARRDLPPLHGLAAFFLLVVGDETAARVQLMGAGEAAPEVMAAFGLTGP